MYVCQHDIYICVSVQILFSGMSCFVSMFCLYAYAVTKSLVLSLTILLKLPSFLLTGLCYFFSLLFSTITQFLFGGFSRVDVTFYSLFLFLVLIFLLG